MFFLAHRAGAMNSHPEKTGRHQVTFLKEYYARSCELSRKISFTSEITAWFPRWRNASLTLEKRFASNWNIIISKRKVIFCFGEVWLIQQIYMRVCQSFCANSKINSNNNNVIEIAKILSFEKNVQWLASRNSEHGKNQEEMQNDFKICQSTLSYINYHPKW